MAKFTLDTNDDDFSDFLLAGICSHAKSYRLCWSLNQEMQLKLTNTNEPIVITNNRKKKDHAFEVFSFYEEDSRINFYLISNKSDDGYLLPEFKHADYLLMLKENLAIDMDAMINRIKLSDQVLTAFEIKDSEIKSKENLLF